MSLYKCPQCRGVLTFVSQDIGSKWVCNHCSREFKRTTAKTHEPLAVRVRARTKKSKKPVEPGVRTRYRWWEYVAAFIGIPVDVEDVEKSSIKPIVCLLAAVILLIVGYVSRLLGVSFEQWGLIPGQVLAKGGLTLITSLFLHVDTWHLLPNVYFLVVFGEKVEQTIGHKRFLMLLLTAAIAGELVHMIFQWHSPLPLVGASGGVSGVMLYYAVSFPRQRLGIIFLFQWVRVPAHLYVAFWLLYQIMGSIDQLRSFSPVSYLAHLGGCIAGYILWRLWRRPLSTTAVPLAQTL